MSATSFLTGVWDVHDATSIQYRLNFTAAVGGVEGSLIPIAASSGSARRLRVEATGLSGTLQHRAALDGDTWAPLCSFRFVPVGASSLLSHTPDCTFSLAKGSFTLAAGGEALLGHREAPAPPASSAAAFLSSLGPGKYALIAVLVLAQGAVRFWLKRGGLLGGAGLRDAAKQRRRRGGAPGSGGGGAPATAAVADAAAPAAAAAPSAADPPAPSDAAASKKDD